MGAESFLTLQIVDFAEGVDDQVAALLQAGTGITLTYNDGAGTLTIANTGLGGSTGSVANRVLTANGTGGSTVQASVVTIDGSGNASGLGTVGCGAINSTGNLALSNRITLNGDTYIERTSSGLINIFQSGAVRAAISNGEITATSAFRLTSFNPAAPDISLIRNATGPTLDLRAAGGFRVRTADGSAAGALDCGAITASGTSTINSISAGGGLILVPSATHNAFHGLRLCSTTAASERAVFLVQPTSGEIMIGANNGGGYYPVIYSNGTARLSFATTGQATFSHLVSVGVFTVATLPAAAANAGALAQVTDSSVTTNGSAVSGSGSNRVVVFSNGSTWDVVVA